MVLSEWREEIVNIDDIILDPNLQIRVIINQERIDEFSQIYDKLPPIKVIRTDNKMQIADGNHRYLAAKKCNTQKIKILVKDGSYKEALEIAVKENAKGSLSLSRADKRKAIEKMLLFFPERANTWIADDVGVSMQTVDSVRVELETKGTIKRQEELIRRDSKVTPREYQKSVEPVIDEIFERETSESATMSQQEKADLVRLSTKALTQQYQTPIINKPEVQEEVTQVLGSVSQKGYENVIDRPIAESNEVVIEFIGDETTAIAQAIDIEQRKGIRVREVEEGIAINYYEVMTSPTKLFPKFVMKVSIEEFNKFINDYMVSLAKK